SGYRAGSAFPRTRKPRRQAADDGRSARFGNDRTGRRCDPFWLPRSYYLERSKGATPEQEAAREDRLIDVADRLEVIISKQRNGPTGPVNLFCDIACNAIRDLE